MDEASASLVLGGARPGHVQGNRKFAIADAVRSIDAPVRVAADASWEGYSPADVLPRTGASQDWARRSGLVGLEKRFSELARLGDEHGIQSWAVRPVSGHLEEHRIQFGELLDRCVHATTVTATAGRALCRVPTPGRTCLNPGSLRGPQEGVLSIGC
ncbi:hypothetical protein GCM10017772_37950 [Promicromonospora soli]|uniref:Uncharacterized protein n=1 Tax=Promicromonospora soli TaxID=2035533 RepID=A0A919KZD8_9MICO|nr:hypothetical protein GCM10017772_37950 [Promicromonospora soli]